MSAAAKARGIDAVFVTPSSNLAWSANLAIGRSERLIARLLLADGPAILITPSFEEANHRRTAVADEHHVVARTASVMNVKGLTAHRKRRIFRQSRERALHRIGGVIGDECERRAARYQRQ